MAGHFGYMQGDFMAVGTAFKEPLEVYFDEATFKVTEDGKAVEIYGHLSDNPKNNNLGIKAKNSEDKWEEFSGQFLKIECVIETIEKEYNNKKSKKEPTAISAFIGKRLKELAGDGKYYSLFVNTGASESYISIIETGLTEKGKEVSEDMRAEFAEEIILVAPIETVEHLNSAKMPEKSQGRGRPSQKQIISEKLEAISALIVDADTSKPIDELVLYIHSHPHPDTALAVISALLS